VKWVEDRREHFVSTVHEGEQVHEAELALDADGRILGFRDRFIHDSGAYAPYGLTIPLITASSLIGPYVVPSAEIQGFVVYTHRTPTGAYRGAGRPQGNFVMERLLDRASEALGMDPLEI